MLIYIYCEMLNVYSKIIELYINCKYIHKYSIWKKNQVVSVNVRGLNTTEKRTKIYDWLRDTMVDVVFLQETHFVEKYENSV